MLSVFMEISSTGLLRTHPWNGFSERWELRQEEQEERQNTCMFQVQFTVAGVGHFYCFIHRIVDLSVLWTLGGNFAA